MVNTVTVAAPAPADTIRYHQRRPDTQKKQMQFQNWLTAVPMKNHFVPGLCTTRADRALVVSSYHLLANQQIRQPPLEVLPHAQQPPPVLRSRRQ